MSTVLRVANPRRLTTSSPMCAVAAIVVLVATAQATAGDPIPGPTQPHLMRNVLLWPQGAVTDFDKLADFDVNTLHAFPMVPPKSGGLQPLALTEEWIDKQWKGDIERLHGQGIRVWGSISSTGFYVDRFKEYGLDPARFYALDAQGQPQMMLGGSFGKEVMSSCYNNTEWMALLESTTLAYVKAGFDGTWYDVGGYADGAVLYCHCNYCQDNWKKFAVTRGLSPDTALPTAASGTDFTQAVNRVHLAWRYSVWENAFRKIRDTAKALNPDLLFLHNLSAMPDGIVSSGLYHVGITKLYDAAHWEEWGHSAAPYSLLPSYFLGQMAAGGRPVILVQNDQPARTEIQHRIAFAEAYAAGGVLQNPNFPAVNNHFFHYLQQHEDLYTEQKSMATVAVVTSIQSRDYYENNARVKPAYWMGWLLQDLHIPYDYVLAERDLTPERLAHYKAVILPDLAVMADSQLSVLRRYIEGGGRVLATNNTARYNPDMLDAGHTRLSMLSGQEGEAGGHLTLGAGRFVYDAGYPEKIYTESNPRDLAVSANLKVPGPAPAEFKTALDWLTEGVLPVQVIARPTTAVVPQQQQGRILLHVINYNTYPDGKQLTKDENVRVTVRLPPGQNVTSARALSPDTEGFSLDISLERAAGTAQVAIPSLETYVVVVLDLEAQAPG